MEWLQKSFEHAPALVAMIIIVRLFLGTQKEMMASHSKRTDEFIQVVREINAENLAEKKESQAAIRDNTRATNEMTSALSSALRHKNFPPGWQG